MSELGEVVFNPEVQQLMRHIGVPYWWGLGQPSSQWPPTKGVDCSGWAQMALVFLHKLKSSEPDRNALALANACLPTTTPSLGTLCFYGSRGKVTHVMVYLANGWTIGATGGGSSTQGDVPSAYVKLEPVKYRTDFICYGNIKKEFQP